MSPVSTAFPNRSTVSRWFVKNRDSLIFIAIPLLLSPAVPPFYGWIGEGYSHVVTVATSDEEPTFDELFPDGFRVFGPSTAQREAESEGIDFNLISQPEKRGEGRRYKSRAEIWWGQWNKS